MSSLRSWTRLAIGSALTCALAGGCGESNPSVQDSLRADLTRVSAVSFSATTTLPSNPPPDVQVTVAGPAAVDVAQAILALPAMPPGVYNCPADFGVSYFLVFTGGNATGAGETVMFADLTPSGCQNGDISSDGRSVDHFWTATSPDFWSRLAGDLGVPETDIYPYRPPS